jgi:hypothetical protein
MSEKLSKVGFLVGVVVLTLLSTTLVAAVLLPEGPTSFTRVSSTRRTPALNHTTQAYAGNVTQLMLVGKSVTQSWQGYAGNVSGTITLDDSAGDTMYDWAVASPQGEVYATYLPTVDWTTGRVYCWNWSGGGLPKDETLRLGELEGWDTTPGEVPTSTKVLGVAQYDVDGINETFSAAGIEEHTSFYVGGQYINGSEDASCPLVKLYNSSGTGVFEQVLLFNNHTNFNSRGVIYTSIIQQDTVGYDGKPWDFQMIVGEDGHRGNTATTNYYFFVELE